MKTEKTFLNATHKKIIKQFGTISAAARALRFSRVAIYDIIKGGLTETGKDRIRGRGFDPKTFKAL